MAIDKTDNLRYKTIKDLGKIVSLFEDREKEERNVTDISKSLQMLPSKVSRLLKTLESEGFFERSPDTGKYRIGPRFLQDALFERRHRPKIDAQPFLLIHARKLVDAHVARKPLFVPRIHRGFARTAEEIGNAVRVTP